MVTIKVASKVKEAYTYENGLTVFNAIKNEFEKGNNVELSFDGFTVIPTSFANGCFVVLLEKYGLEEIKKKLKVTHSTKQINQMIKSRLEFENTRIQNFVPA